MLVCEWACARPFEYRGGQGHVTRPLEGLSGLKTYYIRDNYDR